MKEVTGGSMKSFGMPCRVESTELKEAEMSRHLWELILKVIVPLGVIVVLWAVIVLVWRAL